MRLIASLLCLLLCSVAHAAEAQQVGFETVTVPVAANATVPVDVWYPTSATPKESRLGLFQQVVAEGGPIQGADLRLIVISHGNGGTREGHHDTAFALARAGFVVAALEHSGDNYRDQSEATNVLRRPRELHHVIDYMLSEWPRHDALNAAQVGAFGFSSGGFTVLVAAGGTPDLSLVGPHCREHPAFQDCSLIAAHGDSAAGSEPVVHDLRIKAVVAAAPALGFTLAHGLGNVTQPVQLWRADSDTVLPAPEYADAVRAALPRQPEFHTVPNAGHFDFLAPCSPQLMKMTPSICEERPGFSREDFHRSFNAAVVTFFQQHLADPPQNGSRSGGGK